MFRLEANELQPREPAGVLGQLARDAEPCLQEPHDPLVVVTEELLGVVPIGRGAGWFEAGRGLGMAPAGRQAAGGPEPDRQGGRVSEPEGLAGPAAGLPSCGGCQDPDPSTLAVLMG